jgi:hypothetical protein
MSLSKKQQRFTECICTLIAYGIGKGYAFTVGDFYRDPRVHGKVGEKKSYAASKSVHKVRLAADLNLFVGGHYITDGDHPAYVELGEFWEGIDPDARWGGRFRDANHFSFQHGRMK